MYFSQIDLLISVLKSQNYNYKLLTLLPPSYEQRGQMCKVLALCCGMQWTYQHAPEQYAKPPFPTKADIRKKHLPQQVNQHKSLREQAKKLNSQVGEIYDIRQLINLAKENGYTNVYYKHYESLDSYQKELMDAIDHEIMVNVFYDVNLKDGSPICNNSYTEHSALVIGYAFKESGAVLAILSTHNQYVAVEIQSLFSSTIQLQSQRKPELFFKDVNKIWRKVDDNWKINDDKLQLRKALDPSKNAVSFRGKLLFYNCSSTQQNNKAYLNDAVMQLNDQVMNHFSLQSFQTEVAALKTAPQYIPLEILVHFLETLYTLKEHQNIERFERYAREFNFCEDIIRICLLENQTEVSGALMDDIFKQNPETKRSIVELTSNALDAKATKVRVSITDGEYRVLDNGIGITAREIFINLLLSKISSKEGLVDVIGRFGIGFYTSMAHKNGSVTVKTHSLKDEFGYILHFRMQQSRMEVNIRADKELAIGTEMIVRSEEIDKQKFTDYLKKHFPYVEDERLIINDEIITLDQNYQSVITKHGKILFKSESVNQGSIKITVAHAFVTEYFYEGANSDLTVVWKLPNRTAITEGRNSVQIDSEFMVELIKELIDGVYALPVHLQTKYLNTISPGIVAMQERNALKGSNYNLIQYLATVFTKIAGEKICIPDEADYLFLENENTVAVSRNILPDNWEDQAGDRIEEWHSEKINAYAIEMNGKKHFFYDAYHHVLFLSATFLKHVREKKYFKELQHLIQTIEMDGKFAAIKNLSEISTHQINTYKNFQFPRHHKLYNHHGGLYHVDEKLLVQIPNTSQDVLLKAPTLIARYPFRGECKDWYGYHFDTTNWAGIFYTKETYLNQDYYVRYWESWNTIVYDQHFQPITGKQGVFLAAWFRNRHHLQRECDNNEEMTRLIVKETEKTCQLIDVATKKTLISKLPLYSYYIPIPSSNYYCIQSIPLDSRDIEGSSWTSENTIYKDNRRITSIVGDMRIVAWNEYYLIFSNTSFHGGTALSLYSKDFECLSKTIIAYDFIVHNPSCKTYQHKNKQLIVISGMDIKLAILFDPIHKSITSLSESLFLGQNANGIVINNSLYIFSTADTTYKLGRVVGIFENKTIYNKNNNAQTNSRFVIYIAESGEEELFFADGKTSSLPKGITRDEFCWYEYNQAFQCIKLKNGYLFKNDQDWQRVEHVQLVETSVDCYALIHYQQFQRIVNSKNKEIYSQTKIEKLITRSDCPYLIITCKSQEKEYDHDYKLIDAEGKDVLDEKIRYLEFEGKKTAWTIISYTNNKKFIINKNGIIERIDGVDRELYQVDCDGYIWYPVKNAVECDQKISANSYFVPAQTEKFTQKIKSEPNFYKLIDSNLLLDPDVINNISFLNTQGLSTKDYSNYLRFIDCDHSIFVTFYSYFAILKHTPSRQQFKDYYTFYQFIESANRNYLHIGMRLLDLIYYCAGNHSEIFLSNKLSEISKLYGLSVLRELYEVFSKEPQKLYYFISYNQSLDQLFAPLPTKLREISYFIFSSNLNLLTENKYNPLFESSNTQTSISILDLIACISLRRETMKNAADIQSVMNLAKQMAGELDTSLALRALKHAIYHLSDISQPLYLREFLQNALDASSQGMKIQVEFFNQAGAHVTRIGDPGQGMDLLILFAYLIIPGNSTKRQLSELIGGRGVGFFSAFNGAKEITVKTSTGNGTTYYFKFEPCYDMDQKIYDITITAYQKNEYFKGTIIDRISRNENAPLEAARSLSAIRQYGCFVDANKVKILVNQTQINKDLEFLGELHFTIGTFKIYGNAECAFTAGGLFVKNIDDFYWHHIPKFIMLALKDNGILIDLPSKIALVRERNNFQNADRFIEFFEPLFFQLCLNAYCILLKKGKISASYLPYDLFQYLQPGLNSFMNIKSIKNDIELLNKGQLLTDYKKYLNHDLCIKLLVHIDFSTYGSERISIAKIAELNKHGRLQYSSLPDFIVSRLKHQKSCISYHHKFHELFTQANNEYEKQLLKYQYCSWLPEGAFAGAPNWELFYNLIHKIVASVAQQYGLSIIIHFSTSNPSALAYVEPQNFQMVKENNSIIKKTVIFVNPFAWWNNLNNAFFRDELDTLITNLISTMSHEISHLIEGSGCSNGIRALTHDHLFNQIQAETFCNMLLNLDLHQLNADISNEIEKITKAFNETPNKYLPNAKELMIMQILGKEDYLQFLQDEENNNESTSSNHELSLY